MSRICWIFCLACFATALAVIIINRNLLAGSNQTMAIQKETIDELMAKYKVLLRENDQLALANEGLVAEIQAGRVLEGFEKSEEQHYLAGQDNTLKRLAKEVIAAESNPVKLHAAVCAYAINIRNKKFLEFEGVCGRYSNDYLVPQRLCREYVFMEEEMQAYKTGNKTKIKITLTEETYGGHRYIMPQIQYFKPLPKPVKNKPNTQNDKKSRRPTLPPPKNAMTARSWRFHAG